MTDHIIDTIAAHRPYGLDCKCGQPINTDEAWARHLVDALRGKYAIVELPAPDVITNRSAATGLAATYGDVAAWTDGHLELDYQSISIEDARTLAGQLLAAALLAATNHAGES